jgi:hypothetical protein
MKTLEQVKAEYLETAKKHKAGEYVIFNPDTGKVAAHSAAKFQHTFDQGKTWVWAEKNSTELFLSKDGSYYEYSKLPEQDDSFVTEKYVQEVKAERNQRISDCDTYAQLGDITIQRAEGESRSAMTDDERAELLAYRTALRDFPEAENFPFADFPEFPSALAYELGKKVEQREMMRSFNEY